MNPSWQIVAAEDLDGDIKAELVWENITTGALVVWYVNGTALCYQTTFSPYNQVDSAWKIQNH